MLETKKLGKLLPRQNPCTRESSSRISFSVCSAEILRKTPLQRGCGIDGAWIIYRGNFRTPQDIDCSNTYDSLLKNGISRPFSRVWIYSQSFKRERLLIVYMKRVLHWSESETAGPPKNSHNHLRELFCKRLYTPRFFEATLRCQKWFTPNTSPITPPPSMTHGCFLLFARTADVHDGAERS